MNIDGLFFKKHLNAEYREFYVTSDWHFRSGYRSAN